MVTGQISRRLLLGTAPLTFCRTAFCLPATEFWNVLEPVEWSPAEVQIIATNSPWARKVRAEAPPDPVQPMSDFNRGYTREAQAAESRGIRNGPAESISAAPQRTPKGGGLAFYGETIIRWESAPPIASVMKLPLPPDRYTISVTGLPAQLLASVVPSGLAAFAGTSLKFRNQPDLPLETCSLSGDKKMLLFSFPKTLQPAPSADGNAAFTMNCRGLILKTTFDLRTMTYKGMLAI
ncbi:MAG: hypothetical protein JWN34_6125 [Bryobacterales bacterium]|nr:hypothetical protein [Bryobacterales bacterium]